MPAKIPPPEPEALTVQHWGRTLLYAALAQNDVDMDHHQLLNLDTSNLIGLGTPPTIHPAPNQWLHDWDATTHQWTTRRPAFVDLSGNLTTGPDGQQRQITELGVIAIGTWHGTVIEGQYLTTLNLIRPPAGDVSMANHKLTNLSDPTQPGDAVNLRFLDSMIQGLNPKQAVRVATTGSVGFIGVPGVGGIPLIDGKILAVGDRVLVKDQQARPEQNGIYTISASGHWPRATDCSATDPAHPETNINRAYCAVREGNVNGGTAWVEVYNVTLIDTSFVSFVLFSSASGVGPPGPPGAGVPEGGTAGQVLAKIDGANFNTHWIDAQSGISGHIPYAFLQTGLMDPAGTTSQPNPVMMGLGRYAGSNARITPTGSGKIVVTVAGSIKNDNPAGASGVRLWIGASSLFTAPANGDPTPPTNVAVPIGGAAVRGFMSANAPVPFSVSGIITGVSLGSELWIDLALASGGAAGSKAILNTLSVTAYEIP
jgi:hypothetical protein